jgi:preprotein translocase subunit YajC
MTNFPSNFLVSEAFAETTSSLPSASSVQSGFMNFLPLILIFLVFYFLLIRPQQKKFKEHQNVLNTLKSGDKVHTNSGIIGVIKSIDSKTNIIDLEISENVVIKILKQSVTDLVKNPAPAKDHKPANKKKK